MKSNTAKKPVVVCVKDDQPNLVRYGAQEALRRDTELLILHVYGVVSMDPYTSKAIGSSPQDEADAAAALDHAKDALSQLAEQPPARFVKELGPVIETAERYAAEAQLLVVGADEISWFERVLGGSIARYLVEHTAGPVVMVPHIHDLESLDGGVCVAIDDDARAVGPLRFAFEEASARQSRLFVLHIVPQGLKGSELEAERASVAEVLAGWRAEFPDVVVTTRVIFEDEVVTAVARASEQSELLVVGRPRRSFLAGHAVATRLTRTAHCPLAVVDGRYGAGRTLGTSGARLRALRRSSP
ncbi:universal stress protein [Aeromicrobium sp.]|uniref:universal stress protein n=1 Tax=Aeromicrobium sp. TaxID=1871063 RepID=UPI003D6A51ED